MNDEDLGLESEEEKEQAEKAQEENKELLDFVVSSLGGKIAESKISHKLKSHPVCLTTRGAVTLEMEKYFNSVPTPEGEAVKAERVLELNADHPAFASLKNAYENDREKAEKYARLLYFQSQLIAGDPIENPAEFAGLEMCIRDRFKCRNSRQFRQHFRRRYDLRGRQPAGRADLHDDIRHDKRA